MNWESVIVYAILFIVCAVYGAVMMLLFWPWWI